MTYSYDLPLLGGVVQAQRLVLPPQAINGIKSFRHACRLAWKLRTRQGMTKRQLAEEAGLYASHVNDYFSVNDSKREMPARHIAMVERILGNTAISQYLASQARLTVMEELQAMRAAA